MVESEVLSIYWDKCITACIMYTLNGESRTLYVCALYSAQCAHRVSTGVHCTLHLNAGILVQLLLWVVVQCSLVDSACHVKPSGSGWGCYNTWQACAE